MHQVLFLGWAINISVVPLSLKILTPNWLETTLISFTLFIHAHLTEDSPSLKNFDAVLTILRAFGEERFGKALVD
jgi:hypothetical protein